MSAMNTDEEYENTRALRAKRLKRQISLRFTDSTTEKVPKSGDSSFTTFVESNKKQRMVPDAPGSDCPPYQGITEAEKDPDLAHIIHINKRRVVEIGGIVDEIYRSLRIDVLEYLYANFHLYDPVRFVPATTRLAAPFQTIFEAIREINRIREEEEDEPPSVTNLSVLIRAIAREDSTGVSRDSVLKTINANALIHRYDVYSVNSLKMMHTARELGRKLCADFLAVRVLARRALYQCGRVRGLTQGQGSSSLFNLPMKRAVPGSGTDSVCHPGLKYQKVNFGSDKLPTIRLRDVTGSSQSDNEFELIVLSEESESESDDETMELHIGTHFQGENLVDPSPPPEISPVCGAVSSSSVEGVEKSKYIETDLSVSISSDSPDVNSRDSMGKCYRGYEMVDHIKVEPSLQEGDDEESKIETRHLKADCYSQEHISQCMKQESKIKFESQMEIVPGKSEIKLESKNHECEPQDPKMKCDTQEERNGETANLNRNGIEGRKSNFAAAGSKSNGTSSRPGISGSAAGPSTKGGTARVHRHMYNNIVTKQSNADKGTIPKTVSTDYDPKEGCSHYYMDDFTDSFWTLSPETLRTEEKSKQHETRVDSLGNSLKLDSKAFEHSNHTTEEHKCEKNCQCENITAVRRLELENENKVLRKFASEIINAYSRINRVYAEIKIDFDAWSDTRLFPLRLLNDFVRQPVSN